MTRRLRVLAPALAVALLPVTASPAVAADSQWRGRCGFNAISQASVTGPDEFVGVVDAAIYVYSPDDGNVVNATVTCSIRVNGEVADSASRWGSGVVVVAGTVAYTASDWDTVELCTTVDFTSDDTPTETVCWWTPNAQIPPQEVMDLLDPLVDWLNALVVGYVDPAVCQVFPLLAPGLPPEVTVNEQGDVFLGGEPFWDCPPYDLFPQPDPPPSGVPVPPFVPTGAGYNVGNAGVQLLTAPETRDVAAACAFATDTGFRTITVRGSVATAGADAASVRCRLLDTATGAVLYDQTASAGAPVATLDGAIPANAGEVTVCTEGTGVWGDRTVTVGPYCRPGERLTKLVP